MPHPLRHQGYTMPELIVSIAILIVIFISGSQLAKNIISFNSSAEASLNAQLEGRKVLKIMVAELRTTAPSALGAYPLDVVATSTLAFYADINGNGVMERVRYFLDPTTRTLRKGVIVPTGNPMSYNTSSETFSTLVTDLVNGTSTNLFDYFDSSYAGTTTPLVAPDPSKVRLIRITVLVDRNPDRSPNVITLISKVGLRNLKDNL